MVKIVWVAGVMIFTALLATGCGGSNQTDNIDNSGESNSVVISGIISLADPGLKPVNRKSSQQPVYVYRYTVATWANAIIQAIDSSGKVVASTYSEPNGSYSLLVPPGINYFLRASKGNLVLKAFIENAGSDLSNERIDPSSSAVVEILAQVIGNLNSGEPGADVSGSIGQVDIASTILAIKSNGNFPLLVEIITTEIANKYNPDGSLPSTGSAGHEGDPFIAGIFNAVNGTDAILPTILLTSPSNGGRIEIKGSVKVSFSEDMTALRLTASSFIVKHGEVPVPGTVSYGDDNTAIFTPHADFLHNAVYTALLLSSVTDLAGNPLGSDYSWSFTTGTGSNNSAPGVSFTYPANGTTGVSTSSTITVTFSEPMIPGGFTTETFIITDGVNGDNMIAISGSVTYSGNTATFTPSTELTSRTTYTARLDGSIFDLTDNVQTIQPGYSWSFTTASSSPKPLLSDINFPDVNFRSCVLGSGAVYTRDLKSLSCENKNIVDLTGIGNLTSLTYLYLYNNQVMTIPAEIGKLTALTSLYLGSNQLASIPHEIGKLTALNYLYLNSNQLTMLPAEIGHLTALKYFLLWNNQLTALPKEIGKLSALNYLLLWNNQLKSLPVEIGKLTALTSLDLDKNQIITLPAEMGNLTALTSLYLSSNQLTALPVELGNLSALLQLRFADNNFIPCADITNLVVLLGAAVVHQPALCADTAF